MIIFQLLSVHRNEYLVAMAVASALFMVILCMSWSSPALPKLLVVDSPIPITADEGSWIVAVESIGMVLGPFLTAIAADGIGRKRTLLYSAVPVLIGWLLTAFGNWVEYLYLAQFLFGISCGTVFSVGTMYLSETCSQTIRGSAVLLSSFCGQFAVIIMYGIGPRVEFRTLAWIGMVGPLFFIMFIIWMPESPHFLLGKSKFKEAESSLVWLRRSSDVTKELEAMKTFVQRSSHERGSFMNIFATAYRKNIRIVCILLFSTSFIGVTTVLTYAQMIFMKISSDLEPADMSMVLGIILALSSALTALIIDRVGRRPLLLFSAAGSTLGLLITSAYFATSTENSSPYLGWMAFITLLLVVVSFSIGLFEIPPIINAEVLPKPIRAYAIAACIVFQGVIQFVNAKLFQILTDYVGSYVPFVGYSIAGVIGGVLIYLYVPETKGLSLEEIEQMIAAGLLKPVKRVSELDLL